MLTSYFLYRATNQRTVICVPFWKEKTALHTQTETATLFFIFSFCEVDAYITGREDVSPKRWCLPEFTRRYNPKDQYWHLRRENLNSHFCVCCFCIFITWTLHTSINRIKRYAGSSLSCVAALNVLQRTDLEDISCSEPSSCTVLQGRQFGGNSQFQ